MGCGRGAGGVCIFIHALLSLLTDCASSTVVSSLRYRQFFVALSSNRQCVARPAPFFSSCALFFFAGLRFAFHFFVLFCFSVFLYRKYLLFFNLSDTWIFVYFVD